MNMGPLGDFAARFAATVIAPDFNKNYLVGLMARKEEEERRAMLQSRMAAAEEEKRRYEDEQNAPHITTSPYANAKLGAGVMVTAIDKRTGKVVNKEFIQHTAPSDLRDEDVMTDEDKQELRNLYDIDKINERDVNKAEVDAVNALNSYKTMGLPPPSLNPKQIEDWASWKKTYGDDENKLVDAVNRSHTLYFETAEKQKLLLKKKKELIEHRKKILSFRPRARRGKEEADPFSEPTAGNFDPFAGL